MEQIVIKGARQHNLKNVDVAIPRNKITVITGPSGSGKSSLAIDTIYAEGNRRYVESLSPYARQFIEQMEKPDFDSIEGLSPCIAINQNTVTRHLRSTVGTITEIYNYMRVLYAKIGKPFCYECGNEISSQDFDTIINTLLKLPIGTKIQILSPLVREKKGEYKKELQRMKNEGFIRARIDGKMVSLLEEINLKKQKRHNIDIVIDRLIIKDAIKNHLQRSINLALKYSDSIIFQIVDENRDVLFSKSLACNKCGISYPEIDPSLFSFNTPKGACPKCNGLGFETSVVLNSLDEEEEFEGDMSQKCKLCDGTRLKKEALGIKIGSLNIAEFSALSVVKAKEFIRNLNLSDIERIISRRILKEVSERLDFIERVGLGYLTIDRSSLSISGGEAQRIRLASQIGSSLTGAVYILDEPSIGLHPRDFDRLIKSLHVIRDNDNTVIIVEHDEETIRGADFVVDMGPGAGENGGRIIVTGKVEEIINNPNSLTGKYLRGEKNIPLPSQRRKSSSFINIYGARAFNLKSINISIPLGVFCCITGLSGSGKSSLVYDCLYLPIIKFLTSEDKSNIKFQNIDLIDGLDQIDKVLLVDQKPLGKTPRSNPATYTGIFNHIRELFSASNDAKMRGFTPSHFSFNLTGGRCETCHGDGLIKVVMPLLPNAYVTCDDCKGRRYNKEILEIKYKGKNISEVLQMTVSEAFELFQPIPRLRGKLELLRDIGLAYLQLGQPANTLSGGEAQRLRLSKELSKKSTGNTLYILDEPTTGLHFADIDAFITTIQRLVNAGNTVIVIEHDMNVVKCADYIIDLGPEGGDNGGFVMATGTPEDVAESQNSYTAKFLKKALLQMQADIR